MCLCSRVSRGFLIACLTAIALAAFTRYQAAHADTAAAAEVSKAIEQITR
jgi:hypothetical protein